MGEAVLVGRELTLAFPGRGRGRGGSGAVVALGGVSLALEEGEVLGVVGASGSGKSTLVRVLACLQPADSGEVWWAGERVDTMPERRRRRLRRLVQLVFQDPGASFNPRHGVGFALREAARVAQGLSGDEAEHAIARALEAVGLPLAGQELTRRIGEFSGGQRQRLALARALLTEPKALLLDEPVASLDAPLRRHFLASLRDLVERARLAALVVTHDFRVLQGLAHRVLVLLGGKVVEEAPWEVMRSTPRHPYTLALLQAAAGPRPGGVFLELAPSGCPYRSVCSRASAACGVFPPIGQLGPSWVACHHPLEENLEAQNLVQRQREGG